MPCEGYAFAHSRPGSLGGLNRWLSRVIRRHVRHRDVPAVQFEIKGLLCFVGKLVIFFGKMKDLVVR
jgi:hypothetical protein